MYYVGYLLFYISGARSGLSLLLNIEHYEYMRGPNTATGLAVVVHDQKELAVVHGYGIAVPPGYHAFISNTITQVTKLKYEYVIYYSRVGYIRSRTSISLLITFLKWGCNYCSNQGLFCLNTRSNQSVDLLGICDLASPDFCLLTQSED